MTSQQSQRSRITAELVRVLTAHEAECFRTAEKRTEHVWSKEDAKYIDVALDPAWVEERVARYREAHGWLVQALAEFFST